ncbi:MAG: aspartate aminotransferase family protein [Fusobacteriales bacterium]|jgi:acetylornithine/N-succinyldiaminopimelate aminotransferase|nr:aspartate aminotransferase family protein [Fusobacteriales bacterium]
MLLNVYNRFNVNFVKGKGVYLYDDQGNEYLDFVSGIAVNCLGHAHPVIANALKKQGETLIHISNLYYSDTQTKLVDKLTGLSGHERVFFSNSGTEAVELAIKIARKYGNNIDKNKTEIIYMKDSFHGRSTGSLAITGQKKYQEPFEPLMPNVTECLFNDVEDLKSKINQNTCAVILEPVQGESGIQTASTEFLKALKELCSENNALLIFDEIQCGMGRMGTLFAYEQLGVVPDIVTIAKALGGGVPIGACLTKGKANDVMVPGDHGSTYGGNPLVCTVAYDVLTELVDNRVIAGVKAKGEYAVEKLNKLKEKYKLIEEIRGTGLLIGIKLDESVTARDFANTAFENKFLLVPAGNNVLRYFPPLNVTLEEIDKSIEKMEEILNIFEK